MIRLLTFSALSEIPSAFLDTLQDLIAPVTGFASLDGYLRGGAMRIESANIKVSPISALFLGNTFGATNGSELLSTPVGLSASTWYYQYAAISGVGPSNNVVLDPPSTTPPDVNLIFKSGDATRRYIGCFLTDGSGVPFDVISTRGRYVYQNVAPASFHPVASFNTASYTDVSLASWIPPHARTVLLHVLVDNNDAGPPALSGLKLRPKGSGTDDFSLKAVVNGGHGEASDVEMSVSFGASTTTIQAKADNTNVSADVFVRGFTEVAS